MFSETNFVNYLTSISKRYLLLLCEEYRDMISNLDVTVEREKEYINKPGVSKQSDSMLQTLRQEFKVWVKQLPVIGFNSSRYEMNILQRYLIPILVYDNAKLSPIKKGSSFS